MTKAGNLSYHGVVAKGAYNTDRTLMMWDENLYDPVGEPQSGFRGKYVGQMLSPTTMPDARVLMVAVHLPRKQKKIKEEALANLMKYVEEVEVTGAGVDATVIVGDFNTKNAQLQQQLHKAQIDMCKKWEDELSSYKSIQKAAAKQAADRREGQRTGLRSIVSEEDVAHVRAAIEVRERLLLEAMGSPWRLAFTTADEDPVKFKNGIIDNIAFDKSVMVLKEESKRVVDDARYPFTHHPMCAELSFDV